MDEDGWLELLVKVALGLLVAAAIGKMIYRWFSENVWRWISVDVGGWVADHKWWTVVMGIFVTALLIRGFRRRVPVGPSIYTGEEGDEPEEGEGILRYGMAQMAAMSPTAFEQACADLLERDGFRHACRVGGKGDLGADVVAWGPSGEKIVLQCKRYDRPVTSGKVQTFNGTARPEHGADVAVIVGLSGFTAPAMAFAAKHDIVLVGGEELADWAWGEHLYSVIDEEPFAA